MSSRLRSDRLRLRRESESDESLSESDELDVELDDDDDDDVADEEPELALRFRARSDDAFDEGRTLSLFVFISEDFFLCLSVTDFTGVRLGGGVGVYPRFGGGEGVYPRFGGGEGVYPRLFVTTFSDLARDRELAGSLVLL